MSLFRKKIKPNIHIIRGILDTIGLYLRSFIKKNFILNNFERTIVILFFVFLIIYFCVPLYKKPAPESFVILYNHFIILSDFYGFGDTTIKYIISIITNLLITTLTILSAMYVFTHREQKSISPSLYNETKKNGLVVFCIILILLTMIIGHTLTSNLESYIQMKETKVLHPLHGTKILFYKILLWLFIVFTTIVSLIELIKYLFNSMNSDKMLKMSIIQVSIILDRLTAYYRIPKFDSILNNQYKSLHHTVESIFQYLKFLGDNNMNKDFDDNIDSLSIVFGKLKKSNDKYKINIVASHLLNRDEDRFLGIYNSLLRNTLSLILHLYKNNHFNKGKKLTDLYFSLFLKGEDRLKQHFILSLNEFLDSLDTSNERQLKHFLSGLKSLPEDSMLIIYKNLIQKLIIKGNIGILTTVVYDFKEHIIKEMNELNPRLNVISKAIAIQKRVNLKNNAIIILLQSLVKAIEISQYSTTGFLVKYMITNFDGNDINRAYHKLKQNPSSFTSIFETVDYNVATNEETEIGLVSLNNETFEYCCRKMLILLYGQQLFTKKENLWFHENQATPKKYIEIDIEEDFKQCTYVNYVLKKVESVGSKYGLLFFEDKKIMNKIHEKLIYLQFK